MPDMETSMVPYRVPNRKPADIVRGTAGIASTCLPNSPQTTLSDTTVHGSNLWHFPLKQHNRIVWKNSGQRINRKMINHISCYILCNCISKTSTSLHKQESVWDGMMTCMLLIEESINLLSKASIAKHKKHISGRSISCNFITFHHKSCHVEFWSH